MKRYLSCLAFAPAFLFLSATADGKIWRVNNNSGVSSDFTSLTAAHSGAASGDTLHIEGSPYSYGSVNITKKLVIIGAGYYLDENPNSQSLQHTSKTDGITISFGGEGTVIMGLDFGSGSLNIYCSNIVVKRNKFCNAYQTTPDYYVGAINIYYQSNNGSIPVTNVIISQNFGFSLYNPYASNGIIISNNFITNNAYWGDQTTNHCLNLHANTIAIIQNNIFRRGKVAAHNSSMMNNIMIAGFLEGVGNLIANNIGNAAQFGATNGNQQNVDMSTVFVGSGTGISSDGQWKLKTGSPAIGAGYGSTPQNPVDAGMYGGHTPYVLAGLPPVPAIYYFENKPVGSDTDPINVTIKVKSVGN